MPSCIIIGAGIAGLAAAATLQASGWEVSVLDKGRGAGGRMATRRLADTRADHGAQYFTVRSPEFRAFVERLLAEGIVHEWGSRGEGPFEHPRYVGTGGMSAVPKYLAQALDVHTGQRVVRLAALPTGGCELTTDTERRYTADAVLMTIPSPQAQQILSDSGLAASDLERLQTLHYLPCLAVVMALNRPSAIPAPGMLRWEEGDVAWLADNVQKGITTQPSATLHASAAFSQAELDGDLNAAAVRLLKQVEEWIPAESIETYQIHRWRYSLAERRAEVPFWTLDAPFPLLMGGDAFGLGNVEGAYLSGCAMAEQLLTAR